VTLSSNQDNRISEMLLELKRHLESCKKCISAVKARDGLALCTHTTGIIVSIALRYDRLLPTRIAAHRQGVTTVYACPDLAAHGKTFPLIAEPLNVTGVQGALF